MAVALGFKLTSRCDVACHSHARLASTPQKGGNPQNVRSTTVHAARTVKRELTTQVARDQNCLRCGAQDSLIAEPALSDPLIEPETSGGARELLTWVYELPWTRIAIWATVAVAAAQFHYFFSVSCHEADVEPLLMLSHVTGNSFTSSCTLNQVH